MGCIVVALLPKQGKITKKCLQNIFDNLTPFPVVLSKAPFQIQSDDEDVEEFEYEDFPEMPEFLVRASSPQQQHGGRGYKPLGRKRVCEFVYSSNKVILRGNTG